MRQHAGRDQEVCRAVERGGHLHDRAQREDAGLQSALDGNAQPLLDGQQAERVLLCHPVGNRAGVATP